MSVLEHWHLKSNQVAVTCWFVCRVDRVCVIVCVSVCCIVLVNLNMFYLQFVMNHNKLIMKHVVFWKCFVIATNLNLQIPLAQNRISLQLLVLFFVVFHHQTCFTIKP